jgi:hypothetical protein
MAARLDTKRLKKPSIRCCIYGGAGTFDPVSGCTRKIAGLDDQLRRRFGIDLKVS